MDILSLSLRNPFVTVAFIAVLLGYRALAAKSPKVPPLPVGIIILYLLLEMASRLVPATVDPRASHWLDTLAVMALYCAALRMLFAVTVELYMHLRGMERLPRLTRDFLLFASYAVIIFIVLRTRGGVNLAGLITTSAVLTAVVGLSAQSTLGNLFAGLSLQMERPYGIGDWIQHGDRIGRVVGIGWKSTRLINFDNELVYLPNSDIIKNVLTNFSRPSKLHAMKIFIGLDYGAQPNEVSRVILDSLREEPRVLKTPAPFVRLMEYGDFAITYMIRFTYEDYGTGPALRGSIMNRLWYALRRNNIRIPFPIRDVRMSHIERRREEIELDIERQAAREALARVPVLGPLSDDARGLLAERMRIERYGSGETVVWQGDPGSSMYILRTGSCEVLAGTDTQVPVATLVPPAFFGEMSLMTGEPRSATVRARGDSELFAIDKALFAEIMCREAAVADKLAETLAERQAETSARLKESAAERAARAQGLARRIRSFFGL